MENLRDPKSSWSKDVLGVRNPPSGEAGRPNRNDK